MKPVLRAALLAALLAVVLILTSYLEGRAATDPGRDDAYTSTELCHTTCDRDHTMCMEASDPRADNYGDQTSQRIGLQSVCERDMRECLRKCAASPVRGQRLPSQGGAQ